MFNPEKNLIQKEKRKEIEFLINNLRKETFDLISKIAPINENLRINIEQYKDIYSPEEIEKDKQIVDKLKSEILQNKESQIGSGEILEILKTYLFNKFKGDRFICARTSEFDDYFNHVDNLIIDNTSGETVCAVDITADINSERFEKKKNDVVIFNNRGGARVKYSIQFQENKIIPFSEQKIPIILIAIPESFLNKLLDLMIQQKREEFNQNLSIFFNGIKTLIDLYILPPLETKFKILQQSKPEKANLLKSVIDKITSFKNSLEKPDQPK